jgi:uncharacterized damage-inducible protein DinB
MSPETARMLARYKAWGDEVFFDAVAALPEGVASRQRPTLFKSMIGTLNHILVVDLIWQAHLEQRPHGFAARNLVLHAELPALRRAQREIDDWFIAWAADQSEASLRERLPFAFISGEAGAMTRGDMLLHVVNHTSFHRGWVSEMFFDVPARPPATDLPVFLCQDHGEPRAAANGRSG